MIEPDYEVLRKAAELDRAAAAIAGGTFGCSTFIDGPGDVAKSSVKKHSPQTDLRVHWVRNIQCPGPLRRARAGRGPGGTPGETVGFGGGGVSVRDRDSLPPEMFDFDQRA